MDQVQGEVKLSPESGLPKSKAVRAVLAVAALIGLLALLKLAMWPSSRPEYADLQQQYEQQLEQRTRFLEAYMAQQERQLELLRTRNYSYPVMSETERVVSSMARENALFDYYTRGPGF